MRNGSLVNETSSRLKITTVNETSSRLEITNITLEDGAEYSCNVSNTAGSECINASLFITPEIIQQPQSINSTNGSVLNFTCLATGYPSPEYVWEKIDLNEIMCVGPVLNFNPAVFGDEGWYHCIAAINELVNDTVYAVISEIALLTSKKCSVYGCYNKNVAWLIISDYCILTVSPQGSVHVNPDTMIRSIGESTNFTCELKGGPDNNVQWFKGNFQPGNVPNLNETDVDYTISNITSVSIGGNYTCLVVNLAGNDSATVTLYIQPEITLQPLNVTTTARSNVNLTCDADGFPLPSFSWEKDGERFVGDQGNYINKTLSFKPIMFFDEGRYQCIAKTDFPTGSISTINSTSATITSK